MKSFLEKTGRYKRIADKYTGIVYMKRIYPLFKEEINLFGYRFKPPFNVLMHNIIESEGEDMHDHPWPFVSIILKGGYHETTPNGSKWFSPGSVIFRRAKTVHRIEVNKQGVWSLFIHGRETRDWGFVKNGQWIHYSKYEHSRLKTK